MIDRYDIKGYIPKKYHDYIAEINVESEYDGNKKCYCFRYFIRLVDGRKFDCIGIKNMNREIKKALS